MTDNFPERASGLGERGHAGLWVTDPASPGPFAAACVAICVIDREVAARSQLRVAKNNLRVFDERSNLSIDALTTCTR